MKTRLYATLAIALSATTLAMPHAAHAQSTPAAPLEPNTAPAAEDAAKTAQNASKPDIRIDGKWHFVFDTPGGDREFDAEFAVAPDGTVSGTWDKTPVNGTFKDGHLQLAFTTTSQEAGETSQLTIDGKLDDTAATLTGNWTFSTYDGTFKATHPKS